MIGYASNQDYRSFFEDEFRRRRRGLYPPFTLLTRLLTESGSEQTAETVTNHLEQEMRARLEQHSDWGKKLLLISNDRPGVSVLRGRYRRHLLMKMLVGPEADEMIAAMTELASAPYEDADVFLEVNPTTMM